jgi:hypothetical protein
MVGPISAQKIVSSFLIFGVGPESWVGLDTTRPNIHYMNNGREL